MQVSGQTTRRSAVSSRSLGLIALFWAVLQLGGIFSPGLLDDVDSIYIEIAREMLHRHDYVTPYIDGIRFFDKPPLMYWLAAGSMRLFGELDWAARLPLALAVLGLLFAVYLLGLRLFRQVSPEADSDRGALYAALVLGTAIGPYLYTRFFIPDILIALWMTLSVHFFLIALDRIAARGESWSARGVLWSQRWFAAARQNRSEAAAERAGKEPLRTGLASALWPCLGFAATLALNLLTKGLIGLVFPLAFVLIYLLLTRQLRLLSRFHLLASSFVFLALALPWHILAALRNPAIALPPGHGLPARAGWAWFYLYNEHFARFLGRRIPHDYGQTPVWLFWLYAVIWIMPWGIFLPAAFAGLRRDLGHRFAITVRQREAALTGTLWTLIVLGFFTLSSRQEYYSLPALPALALMVGGLLAAAETEQKADQKTEQKSRQPRLFQASLLCHGWLLVPLATIVAGICAFFVLTAPLPAPGIDLSTLLASNPELYNLSLGHLFDLTGAAMGLFRGPLTAVAMGMLALGPASYWFRRRRRSFAANLTLAAGMTVVLLAAHEGLVRFNPILGSKGLAEAIVREQARTPEEAGREEAGPDKNVRNGDLIVLDGELTSGSTLLFYTRQPVHLVNGRINGPWFGSFWPDAPHLFEDENSLRELWGGRRRIFLLTYTPTAREKDLRPFATVRALASAGGKTILTNR